MYKIPAGWGLVYTNIYCEWQRGEKDKMSQFLGVKTRHKMNANEEKDKAWSISGEL